MNETLYIVWASIAIIGIIAIIIVKIYFSDKEPEEYDFSDITTRNPLQKMISSKNKNKDIEDNSSTDKNSDYFSYEDMTLASDEAIQNNPDFTITPNLGEESTEKTFNYASQNQVLINYDESVEKFQEPITPTQRDIMNQNKPDVTFKKSTESKHELKDLFTIDELIKESKRKDNDREKESKTINKEEPENDDLKKSIENKKEVEFSEAPENDDIKDSIERVHEIANALKSNSEEDLTKTDINQQEDITTDVDTEEIIENQITDLSKSNTILDSVTKKETTDTIENKTSQTVSEAIEKESEIKSPALKSPAKIKEDSVSVLSGADEDYEFGAPIDSSNLFEDENGELSDLDYRKDLAKFTNTIKNSSIVKDIREKLSTDNEQNNYVNDEFNQYEEKYNQYEPIINETHVDYFDETPDDILRRENTRKVFDIAKNMPEEVPEKPKEIPEKSSLKITINGNEEVLRKGDEIIYKHDGETYSSKVYSIKGDEIKVKYRRQNITIKASNIKKIY